MKQCIISANCQGIPLGKQLLSFYPFACEYEVNIYTNFTKTAVPRSLLQSCDILIYQRLDDSWGEISEKQLLANVNPKAKVICMPNVLNRGLWPSMVHNGNLAESYRDLYVEELIAQKLYIREIMELVKNADYSLHYNIEDIFYKSLEREREKKYFACDIICDFILNNFRTKQLFTTPNHPYGILLNLIAKLILEEIGYKNVPEQLIANINCDDNFDLPIHPSVAKFLGLSYGDEKQLYTIYGKQFNYYEYLYAYVFARLRNLPVTYFLFECHKKKRIF